jgi:hypothetical protein
VARFVRLTAQIAAAHGTKLSSVDERMASTIASAPASATAVTVVAPVALDAVLLEATLTGDYRSLLATMRALIASPLPLQLELTSLARTGVPDAASAALTARLRVSIERFANGAGDAPAHSTPP